MNAFDGPLVRRPFARRSLALVLAVVGGAASAADTRLVSSGASGTNADGMSWEVSISRSGRFVAFACDATNLVAGDGNGKRDIFIRDTKKRTTVRASVSSSGTESDSLCYNPSLSANGRYVAFASGARTLVDGDTNGVDDVFVHDRKTRRTTRVSVSSDGTQGDEHSLAPSISSNGRYIAFASRATNLVSDDDNAAYDVFVHDRKKGVTTRVSVGLSGHDAPATSDEPSISANGRFVAFESSATNLVEDDGNDLRDVFVHDRKKLTTMRVSSNPSGGDADGFSAKASIGAKGRYVAFESRAANLVANDGNDLSDVFVHDIKTGLTVRASQDSSGLEGNGGSFDPQLAGKGRFVAFRSGATNLVPGDDNGGQDIFVHDRKKRATTRDSVGRTGLEGNGHSTNTSLSANGRYMAFVSGATGLVEGDLNDLYDAFLRDRKQRKK